MQNNIFEAITFAGAVTLLFCYIYKTDFQAAKRKISPRPHKRKKRHNRYRTKPTNSHVFENDYTNLHVEAIWDELSK